MQAEIWRAASHSRFHARYFRVIPGFLGLKSFLNFFKNRVLGPIFIPQSNPKRASRDSESSFSLSPAHFVPQIFLKIFSSCPTSRQPESQTTGQSPKQPPQERSQDLCPTPTPRLQKLRPAPSKAKDLSKLLETTKKPRGEPRGFSGAVDET